MKVNMQNFRVPGKIKYILLGIVVLAVLFILGSGCWYQIEEQEQAVLVTLGKPKTVADKGLHFKVPLIQQVKKVDTTIQGFAIGYEETTNDTVAAEAVMITSDYNFINVDFFVEYRIVDPVKYLYASQNPVGILQNIAQGSIRTVIGSYDVDSVLTTGKTEIQGEIKEMILKKLETEDIGLALVNITIQDSEPPTQEVMDAFKQVETAKQGKETALNNAYKYQNEKLPQAEARADEIVKDAEAQKQTRINEAEAQVARFQSMYQEYEKNPQVTKQRMFYEAMENVLPDMKVVIDSGSGVSKVLPLDSFADTLLGVQETESSDETEAAGAAQ